MRGFYQSRLDVADRTEARPLRPLRGLSRHLHIPVRHVARQGSRDCDFADRTEARVARQGSRDCDFADRTEARVARQGSRDCDFAPLAGRQAFQAVRADRDPHQAQRGITDGSRHATHLAVAPLGDGDLEPARRDRLAVTDRWIARPKTGLSAAPDLCRSRSAAIENDAAPQLGERRVRRYPLDLHPIGFGQLEARIRESLLQSAVVGEQQQPFAVAVQPPGRVDPRNRDKPRQGSARLAIGELAQHAVGFVQRDEPRAGGSARMRGAKNHRTLSERLLYVCQPHSGTRRRP